MPVQNVAVFCGSKPGANPLYHNHAAELGQRLARAGIALVYGGGGRGLMGAVADGVMAEGGTVLGIIPQLLVEWEAQHQGITELRVVDDMHIRKRTIYEACDAAIILAGGFGTLDELFEILTWNALKIHDKKIIVLNSAGFYDHLAAHCRRMYEDGFLYREWESSMQFCETPAEVISVLL